MNYFFAAISIFVVNILVVSSSQDFCLTAACNRTSDFLGLDALITSTINPCDDFGEFVRDGWKKNHPKPIMSDVINTVYERTVDILIENSADDANVTKVAKKMFQSCLDPAKNFLNSWNDIADYLRSLGSSPFIDGPSWQPSSFSFHKLFKAEPKLALKVFFNREIQPCSGRSTSSLCLRDIGFDLLGLTDYEKFLRGIFDIESLQHLPVVQRINETVTALKEFDTERSRYIPFFEKPTTDVTLQKLKESMDVNWVDALNAVRQSDTDELTPDDFIGIEYFEFGKELLQFVNRADKKSLADRFVVHFIYEYRSAFGKSFFSDLLSGLVPESPKFCLVKEIALFFPVLSSLYNRAFFKQEIKPEILKATKEAMIAFYEEDGLPSSSMSLDDLKIHDGFSETGWNQQEMVDKIYANFDLTGDESEFQKARKLALKHNKIRAEPTVSFDYSRRTNAFNIPSFFMSHPAWFDANNPKFYTAATFTVSILEHLTRNRPINAVSLAFNCYKKWLTKGNRELNFNKGNLTNEQLFWITLGMDTISREEEQSQTMGKPANEFLHVQFKSNVGFQEAFHCSMTEAEAKKLKACGGECDGRTKTHEFSEDFMFFVLKDSLIAAQDQRSRRSLQSFD